MNTNLCVSSLLLLGATQAAPAPGQPRFFQLADTVDDYDFVEVVVNVDRPTAENPFTDVEVEGTFGCEGEAPLRVDGFCDSQDGGVYRIRFMPTAAGDYHYAVAFRQGAFEAKHEGMFRARDAGRKGLVRVDPRHPWHFLWEGTGEHYFWNGTTTYWLMAWEMVMAGGYQTTGERADTGTGWGPDTGGGWVNGRGDDSMIMLEGYGRMVDFFTAIPWWTLDPDDGLLTPVDESPVRTELTHLVYTRDREGQAILYVEGQETARTTVPGDLSELG